MKIKPKNLQLQDKTLYVKENIITKKRRDSDFFNRLNYHHQILN